jgi:hypothetical protein
MVDRYDKKYVFANVFMRENEELLRNSSIHFYTYCTDNNCREIFAAKFVLLFPLTQQRQVNTAFLVVLIIKPLKIFPGMDCICFARLERLIH